MINQLRKKLQDYWAKYLLVLFNVEHIHGKRLVSYTRNELIVVSLVKNAEVQIHSFINHYIKLGVKHIVILDNGSTDNTISIASQFPQVSIYSCLLPFREYNLLMRKYLMRRFGRKNHWVLCVDADELFEYPNSDRIDLQTFLAYLNNGKYTTTVAYLLDMFPDQPITHTIPETTDLKDAYPYYDLTSITKTDYHNWYPYHGYTNQFIQKNKLENRLGNPEIKHYMGGIRAKIFDMPKVYLTKHPLMYLDGKTELVHQHFVNYASVADITCVLYHYKFVTGFQALVNDAVKNGQYWNDSMEYRKYYEVLEKNPDICLKSSNARKLGSVNDLVEQDFLQVTDNYLRWCNMHEEVLHRKNSTTGNVLGRITA